MPKCIDLVTGASFRSYNCADQRPYPSGHTHCQRPPEGDPGGARCHRRSALPRGQRAEARQNDPSAPTLEHGLDVFHTTMEAQRVLAQHWRRAEAAWEQAEAADVKLSNAKRQGLDARSVAGPARAAWWRPLRHFNSFGS